MFSKSRFSIAFASALALSAGASHAVTLTTVDGTADNGLSLANTLLGGSSGLSLVAGSTGFAGTSFQSGTYTGFNLTSTDPGEPTLTLDDGILLTSGSANIATSNTDTGFSNDNGLPGHAPTDTALAGFPSFGGTNDANVLSFSVTRDDPNTTSVSTQFVFGSEEFSEYPSFVDSFTFFVDGVNYAVFPNGDPLVQEGTTQGFFNDNENGSYGIEYDGLTNVLTVTGLFDTALSQHLIEIVVADDDDHSLDSGVFLASLSAGTSTGGGIGDPPTNPIPLPAGLPLLLSGLGGLALIRRKTKRS